MGTQLASFFVNIRKKKNYITDLFIYFFRWNCERHFKRVVTVWRECSAFVYPEVSFMFYLQDKSQMYLGNDSPTLWNGGDEQLSFESRFFSTKEKTFGTETDFIVFKSWTRWGEATPCYTVSLRSADGFYSRGVVTMGLRVLIRSSGTTRLKHALCTPGGWTSSLLYTHQLILPSKTIFLFLLDIWSPRLRLLFLCMTSAMTCSNVAAQVLTELKIYMYWFACVRPPASLRTSI